MADSNQSSGNGQKRAVLSGQSKVTHCGHGQSLARHNEPCQGDTPGPLKERDSVSPGKTTRSVWLKVRVTPEERERFQRKAKALDMSLADLVRQCLQQKRVRSTGAERARNLALARIGNNLNQIARYANTHKGGSDAIRIIAWLISIRRQL